VADASEYHDAMLAVLDLIWGDGFMAPGGAGNVARLVEGLDVRGRRVLDIGCGAGGPACLLAATHGARVVGTDLEPHLIERARRRALEEGLVGQTDFRVVEPGPLGFPDASFDVVVSSGAFTQTAAKRDLFAECLRVLRPGGHLRAYDWMKCEGEYSEDMLHFFEMEGLTYAMETPARHAEILNEVGFVDVEVRDASAWYRRRVRAEYEALRGELYPRLLDLIGPEQADHFVEDWRSMCVVCEKGEMLQAYCRARRPPRGEEGSLPPESASE
jgi:phosphoethanolamine N-methyltransferase